MRVGRILKAPIFDQNAHQPGHLTQSNVQVDVRFGQKSE
jgi:hypothetical protein